MYHFYKSTRAVTRSPKRIFCNSLYPYPFYRRMSMAKPRNSPSDERKTGFERRNEALKDVEELFTVDDSFGDDVQSWSAPMLTKQAESDDEFSDFDENELVLLTSPKKIKPQVSNSSQVPKKLQFSNKIESENVDGEDEIVILSEVSIPKCSQNRKTRVRENLDSDSWTFSLTQDSAFQKIEDGPVHIEVEPVSRIAPIPKLAATSSRLTETSNTIDTSPEWHRHETWLNIEKNSSPAVNRRVRTPLLELSSSPPKISGGRSQISEEQEEEEEEVCIRPISRMKPSEIAMQIISRHASPAITKRAISTSARTSARTRNSTIELMTQRPNIHIDFDDEENSIVTTGQLEKNVKPVILSEEQLKVIEIAKQGESLFYTGSAGTGKSILLRSLIKTLRTQHGFDCVGVTASTGLAACNIGGSTLHSLTGIGLGNGDVKSLVKKIKKSKKNLRRWKTLKVLIIDEISMIEGELLDKLNDIGKELRKCSKPFGGIQLIVCGDFYQLPPVAKDKPAKFAFESDSWKEAIEITIILKKVFRQQGDTEFVDMLNDIRCGLITSETAYQFQTLSRPLPADDEIEATELFPTRQEVDRSNNERLGRIKQPLVQFNANDSGTIDDETALQRLLNNFLAPKTLQLKKGAQVMMIKNIDETLVNGSLGRVLDFVDPDTYMFYERLSSGHQVDDADLESHIDGSKIALDASKTFKSEYLGDEASDGLDENIFDFFKTMKADPADDLLANDIEHKKNLINTLHHSSKGKRLPLVRFKLTDGNTRDVLVEAERFEVEDPQNEHMPLASRQQLPLILAWALSIHKSQGQTLTKVKVNLQRVFEKGQAYVALSRATSRGGLQILNFNPSKVMAHPRVITFYQSLFGVDDLDMDARKNKRSHTFEDDGLSRKLRPPAGFSNQSDFVQLEDSDFSSDQQ